MASQVQSRPHPALVWALCILAGLMVGVSGFSAESNHPTYLPPGIRYADPTFLAGDWWLNSAQHYHFAFFGLVAALTRLGILEAGLALLNILAVATAAYGCFQIVSRLRSEYPVTAFAFVIALLLASGGFYTIGNAYLFSNALQPSTIATTATIMAMAAFLDGQPGRCGLWLALAGAFHANFLVLNIAAFGLAFMLSQAQALGWRNLVFRDAVLGILRMLWPSLVLLGISAPLILSIQAETVSPAVAAQGDWILFHFAVPFHYYPLSYLFRFPSFLALQALGLIWTGRAISDLKTRQLALALQWALAALIWSATALTTLVFIAPVSRLFVWRMAPFALLLAALLIVVGILRVIARTDRTETQLRQDGRLLRISLYALPLLAYGGMQLQGQILPTAPFQPLLLLIAGLCLIAIVRHLASRPADIGKPALAVLSGAMLVFGLLTQISYEPRYSLLHKSQALELDEELFRYVARSTPRNAQFVIPPTLGFFRLRAERAVVVDFKALPMNRSGMVEWYRRLEAISGTRSPASYNAISLGYSAADAIRLEQLRCRYHVSYAVFDQPNALQAPGWREVFSNKAYRVLQFAGQSPCLDNGLP